MTGFAKPEIWSLKRLAFSDDDFAPNSEVDRPMPEIKTLLTKIKITRNSQKNVPESSASASSDPSTSASPSFINLCSVLEGIRPFPKAPLRNYKSKRERGKSRIYSATEIVRLVYIENSIKEKNAAKSIKTVKPIELLGFNLA